ncbi:MAG: alcohol dehydrogenase catalytic domain-containing protein, partial [Acidobacteriota bacterium]|nr:alcohol dehydrogenase catalytic domain-containing protein [Acidobacteriota bacterium]
MKAVCWMGKEDVQVLNVPDPKILNERDAIIKITRTAICGSDLHLYNGYIPAMKPGDILGHEFMGEVVETGRGVSNLKQGDKVVVPFTIACGNCFFCQHEMYSVCDNSNPKPEGQETAYGFAGSGLFGFSHLMGGFAGGQAEYARVPFADVGPIKVPDSIEDEKVLFLSDIFPTGFMAADNCNIQEGDTVAIWGAGPVGQFATKSAFMLGAEKVVVNDHYQDRLDFAKDNNENVETIIFDDTEVHDKLKDLTGGRGPDSCIDAVGLESHGTTPDAILDRVKA